MFSFISHFSRLKCSSNLSVQQAPVSPTLVRLPLPLYIPIKLTNQTNAKYSSFDIGEKNIKHAARKLFMRKYDPIVNQYVLFTEHKLKK